MYHFFVFGRVGFLPLQQDLKKPTRRQQQIVLLPYRPFATRLSQLKILAFLSYWYRKKRLQMHF
jgi:hypothetical protein